MSDYLKTVDMLQDFFFGCIMTVSIVEIRAVLIQEQINLDTIVTAESYRLLPVVSFYRGLRLAVDRYKLMT